MKSNKANIAGLTSREQQSEMKSILAGTWPPLKPLPVFKYETAEYRATIDFDRKRGEWVCRKTSLPSNQVQELRGGLREITMALPHGEAEMFIEEAEQQGQELEKDANRRLQAIHDWRQKYENGARYSELREYLSESQRTELDDSLRLSLTARQLQFNPKNAATVFDDLSIAGGRFAALIEFAKQNKAKQGTRPQAEGEGAVLEVERANTSALELPALSIKDVFSEQDQAPLLEPTAQNEPREFEIETSETVSVDADGDTDLDAPAVAENPHEEGRRSPAFSGFASRVRTSKPSTGRTAGWSLRIPAFQVSKFQVKVFALLFLFAVTAFGVGLTLGRGPLGRRLPEATKPVVALDAKSPAPRVQANEPASRASTPPVASTVDSAGSNRGENAMPPEEESKESPRFSDFAGERSAGTDSSLTTGPNPPAKPEVRSERRGAIGGIARNAPPSASSKLAHSRKAPGPISSVPRSPASYTLTSATGVAPHLPGPSTILVSVPGRGSRPFRVNFPEKAIAATSSFAMTSQLSVVVPPESGPAVADKSARLEGGELASFVWPHYPRPKARYGLAETIKVRATIGQLGQVLEVKFLGGSASLLSATTGAIRQWHYRPTLLDKQPVQAQQDITIEFRPPEYELQASNRRSSQHSSHN